MVLWHAINGERKKVACGPCIRGHRSSKCDHTDRLLIEVRKPGRPLSSCPHPSGSCSCDRVTVHYAVPKASVCPSASSLAAPGATNRIQKHRHKKSVTSFTSASLEKVLKSDQGADPDALSLVTTTSTSHSLATSDTSNGVSPSSSTSSTPRIAPKSQQRSCCSNVKLKEDTVPERLTRAIRGASTAKREPEQLSGCCKPELSSHRSGPLRSLQAGGCCENQQQELPKPATTKKSCCSEQKQDSPENHFEQINAPQNASQRYGGFNQFPQDQYPFAPHMAPNNISPTIPPGSPYMPIQATGTLGMLMAYGFSPPIYNHLSSSYQQPHSMMRQSPQSAPGHPPNQNTPQACDCGDSCMCFGCATHPHNETTTRYVQSIDRFQTTGEFGTFTPLTYDVALYPQQTAFGAHSLQHMGYDHAPQPDDFTQAAPSYQMNMNTPMGIPNTQASTLVPWQNQSTQHPVQSTPIGNEQFFAQNTNQPDHQLVSLETENATTSASPTFTDSPSEDNNSEELSPSAYTVQELELPGCNDPSGTCMCGDGCNCVGCLTHGGHNGVPLETPAITQQDQFTQALIHPDLSADYLTDEYFQTLMAGDPT